MNLETYAKYPFVLLLAAVVTYILTPVAASVLHRLGIVDRPNERRVHTNTVPRGGGVAVYLGVVVGLAGIFLIPWTPFSTSFSADWFLRYALLATLVVILGLVDDKFEIGRFIKLAGQIMIALLTYAQGISIDHILSIEVPFGIDLCLTVFWIVALMNAFNLIDGMDGLAAGLAAISALGLAGSVLVRNLPGDALVYLAVAGACLAFLRYNFNPASVFLGDTGSLFLGYSLAVMSLVSNAKGTVLATLGVSILALGIPVLDVMLAVWRRAVRRLGGSDRGVMEVDLEHLHHRLMGSGMSQRRVSLTLYLLNLMFVVVGLLALSFHSRRFGIFLLAFLVGAYIVLRHLARVELWDSGRLLVEGLRRPAAREIAVVSYPAVDVVILSLSLLAVLAFQCPPEQLVNLRRAWLQNAPLWVGLPFLGIAASRAYLRVWSRARTMDYIVLVTGFLGAVAAVVAVVVLVEGSGVRNGCMQGVAYAGLVLPCIVGVRSILRVAQDWMASASGEISTGRNAGARRTLVYGAGLRGLGYMKFLLRARFDLGDTKIVGWIDDDDNLRERLVYGYHVLGSGAELESLVTEHRVRRLVLTVDIPDEIMQKARSLAESSGLELCRWRPELTDIDTAGAG